MSTIKSSDEHLTLNADGTSKDIKFQANGVEKASISSSGAFTSTTIDATKLTGTIPNFTSTGIDDNADATAMTIDSSERVGIGETVPLARLHIKNADSGVTSPDAGFDDMVVENSTDVGISLLSTDTGTIAFNDANGAPDGSLQYRHDDRSMRFASAGAERMKIESTGKVLVNETVSGHADAGTTVITNKALGKAALTLKSLQTHAAGVGTEIVALNFAAHNYYSASNPGIYGQISCENGNGTYSDRGQLVLSTGYGGNQITERLVLTSDGRGLSQFTAKAWVVWTGGGTSINDSHNVSSITYLSTGVYEINYSNSLAGTDRYAINVTPSDKSGYWNNSIASIVDGESNASKTRILTMRSTTGGTENVDNIYAIVFGDN